MAICKFCKFESRNPSFAYCCMCGKLLPGHHHSVTIHKSEYDELVAKALKAIDYEAHGLAPSGMVLVNFSDYENLIRKAYQQVTTNKVTIDKHEYERLKEAQKKVRKYESEGYATNNKVLINKNDYESLLKRAHHVNIIKEKGNENFATRIINSIKNFFS